MNVHSERCPYSNSCAINARLYSALRLIRNGRRKSLRDNFARSTKDPRQAIERSLTSLFVPCGPRTADHELPCAPRQLRVALRMLGCLQFGLFGGKPFRFCGRLSVGLCLSSCFRLLGPSQRFPLGLASGTPRDDHHRAHGALRLRPDHSIRVRLDLVE
jgi:hypothetical protein